MKVIFITLFLNYELVLCKSVNQEILDHTSPSNKQHIHTKKVPVLRSRDKIEALSYGQKDHFDVLNYDVTDMLWGGQAGLEGITNSYITSTFLAMVAELEEEGPVLYSSLTLAPEPTDESPEQIDDVPYTDLTPPPRTMDYTFNTNYPGWPYEPPPLDIPYLKPLSTQPKPIIHNLTDPSEIYDDNLISADSNNVNNTTKLNIITDSIRKTKFTRVYSVITEALPSLFTNKPESYNIYTLKRVTTQPTAYADTPLRTAATPTTRNTSIISNYLRNVQKSNLTSNATTLSEKDFENVKKWFNKGPVGTPLQSWMSSLAQLTKVPQTTSTTSKPQLWLQKIKAFANPVLREGGMSSSMSPPPSKEYKSTETSQVTRFVMETEDHLSLRTTPKSEPYRIELPIVEIPATAYKPHPTTTKSTTGRVFLKVPQENSTTSKPQLWVQKIKTFANPVLREGVVSSSMAASPPTDYELATETNQAERFTMETEDHLSLRNVSDYELYPIELPDIEIPAYDPHPTTTTTQSTTGRVFLRDSAAGVTTSPRQVYFRMMEDNNEGFLTIFLLEILRITLEKDEGLVQEVLHEVKPHINTWYTSGAQAWFGQPLTDIIIKLSRFLSEERIDYIRSHTSMMYHLLKGRKTAVPVDVNSIIEYADLLYTDDEGEELFDALMEYEQYPNGTKDAKQLCELIFDSFMKPYRRLSGSVRIQALFNSINDALMIRFPSRRSFGNIFRFEPQTTTKMKSKYLQDIYERNRHKRRRKNKKQELSNDVLTIFSSRPENEKSLKRRTKYLRDTRQVINNYYISKVTEANLKSAKDKVTDNGHRERTVNNKNEIENTSIETKKGSNTDVERLLYKNPYFNDFDDI